MFLCAAKILFERQIFWEKNLGLNDFLKQDLRFRSEYKY